LRAIIGYTAPNRRVAGIGGNVSARRAPVEKLFPKKKGGPNNILRSARMQFPGYTITTRIRAIGPQSRAFCLPIAAQHNSNVEDEEMAYAKIKPGDIVRTGRRGSETLSLVIKVESNGYHGIDFEDEMINNMLINIRHMPRKPKRRKFFMRMIDGWFHHREGTTPNIWCPLKLINMVVERGATEVV